MINEFKSRRKIVTRLFIRSFTHGMKLSASQSQPPSPTHFFVRAIPFEKSTPSQPYLMKLRMFW